MRGRQERTVDRRAVRAAGERGARLREQRRIARGDDAVLGIDDEEVEADGTAAACRHEKRRDALVEVADANLAHDVLTGEGGKAVALRAEHGGEAVGGVPRLAGELAADDPRQRGAAARRRDQAREDAHRDDEARHEQQQLGANRESL